MSPLRQERKRGGEGADGRGVVRSEFLRVGGHLGCECPRECLGGPSDPGLVLTQDVEGSGWESVSQTLCLEYVLPEMLLCTYKTVKKEPWKDLEAGVRETE